MVTKQQDEGEYVGMAPFEMLVPFVGCTIDSSSSLLPILKPLPNSLQYSRAPTAS